MVRPAVSHHCMMHVYHALLHFEDASTVRAACSYPSQWMVGCCSTKAKKQSAIRRWAGLGPLHTFSGCALPRPHAINAAVRPPAAAVGAPGPAKPAPLADVWTRRPGEAPPTAEENEVLEFCLKNRTRGGQI